jgi:predicted nucleic acid-binding protein
MPAGAVLDTNVVLDWLVFGDARVAPLVRALTTGSLACHGTPAMRDELARVLRSPALQRWQPDGEWVLATYDSHVGRWEGPCPAAGPSLRCRDSDDQKYIDLALRSGARWLVSHDRALLDLDRRARPRGFGIVTPARWAVEAFD